MLSLGFVLARLFGDGGVFMSRAGQTTLPFYVVGVIRAGNCGLYLYLF
jgi:hypothetical protein